MQSIFNFYLHAARAAAGREGMRLFSRLSAFFLPAEVYRIGGLLSAFSHSLYYAADTAKNEYFALHCSHMTGASLYSAYRIPGNWRASSRDETISRPIYVFLVEKVDA